MPRPFSPGAKFGAVPAPGPSSGLVVHPLAGDDRAALDALTLGVIDQLRAQEVAAIPYDVANRYRLYGEVTEVARDGAKVTLQLAWQVITPNGQVQATDIYLQDTDFAAYQAADPFVIQSMAQAAVGRIAPLLGINVAADTPRAATADLTMVPIRNAPGDGSEALTEAMIRELDRLGRTALRDYRPGLPELEALVTVTPGAGGKDDVRIIWLLRDATGKERGRLEQQNQVPANRLSQRWGVVANLAASAAAPGIVDLLGRLQQN